MKKLIDRISNPKPWMIVLFCFVTIFTLLAFPLQSMRTGAQTDKELSSQSQKGGKIDTGGSVDVISIDPSLVPTDLDRRGLSKTEMTPAAADQPLATPSLDVEPNGTSATASPIAVPARVRGNLFPNGDIDFYSFNATAGDRVYAAVMTSASAGSSTDSQLTLLNSDGTTVNEFDDDNGSFAGLSSSIAGATIPSTGTYFIKVNDFTAGTTSERYYELYVKTQSAAPTPEVEANDTPATANVLPASGHVSGARNPAAATEQDWYSMTLNAGDTVYLSLDVDPEDDLVVWNGRLGMALFGDASNQILVVDDAGTGDVAPNPNRPSEALMMTVKTAGTYYAFVDSASAAVGGPTATYNLNVTVFPKVNEGVNCTTYTSTNVPQTIGPGAGLVSSTITVPGNPRIADLDVSIQLNHLQMNQIDAHLRSPAGNDNGLFTDIGAAAVGGQTQMDTTFDDAAGIPPAFTVLKGVNYKPELAYRLNWFDGENAGGTWTLDLYDDTADANGGTLTGWSMTICEEPPTPACLPGFTRTTVFSSDFESGAAGFTHSGTGDQWALGTPNSPATTTANPLAAFTTCNSGANCWKTNLTGTYNVSTTHDLLSAPINLTGMVGPVIVNWAQKYQMESASFDHMFVDAQQVGGATPVRLFEFLDATMVDGPGNPTVNIGASAGWGLFSRRADSLAGLNTELRFHVDGDTTVNFQGMAVDDVSVSACQAASADLSITKTDGVASVTPGGSTTYTITASNAGPDAVSGATVADTFPASLTGVTWTCVGAGGGTCTAAGSGNINDTSVNLPVGGSVTYTATASVSVTASGSIANTATVSSSTTDPTPGNNSATDTDTVGAGSQGCTLTAGGASYVIPTTSHYDATQTVNWTGVGTGDYLFEDGWWFRVSGDTAESFFPVPTGSACSGANGTVGWADVGNRGLFRAVNSLSLVSASPNTGRLVLTMAVTNLSSTTPLTISLFHGADLDVNGSAATDNATLLVPNNYMRVSDTTAGFADYGTFTPAVNGYLVRPFAATTDVFGLLADTGLTNFDNTGLPASSFDFTGGYQWDRVIPANGTATVSVIITANTPLTASGVAVGGRVLSSEGRGVRGANVTITDERGVSHTVSTGVNGTFRFEDVQPGQTYVVNVRSRRFNYSPQVIQVNDNIADLQFVAGQ